MTRAWGRIGAAPYHSVKCENNCPDRIKPCAPGFFGARDLVRDAPFTAGEFGLHNGFTMLRRFDRSLAIIDQATRTGNGAGLRVKAAKDSDKEDGGGGK